MDVLRIGDSGADARAGCLLRFRHMFGQRIGSAFWRPHCVCVPVSCRSTDFLGGAGISMLVLCAQIIGARPAVSADSAMHRAAVQPRSVSHAAVAVLRNLVYVAGS